MGQEKKIKVRTTTLRQNRNQNNKKGDSLGNTKKGKVTESK
jgi:hypothetical protein